MKIGKNLLQKAIVMGISDPPDLMSKSDVTLWEIANSLGFFFFKSGFVLDFSELQMIKAVSFQ